MKKVAILLLVLFLSITVCSCSGHQYPRAVIAKEPEDSMLLARWKSDLGDFDDPQDAWDEIVDRYNKTHDNEDLYTICVALVYSSNHFENGDELVVAYYNRFFDVVWSDEDFNQKTMDIHLGFADILLRKMYRSGKKSESVDFFEKFASTIQDKDELANFTSNYSSYFYDDYLDDVSLDQDDISRLLKLSKNLERDCYNDVTDLNKAAINLSISRYAEMSGDQQTAEEYKRKVDDIITRLMNE